MKKTLLVLLTVILIFSVMLSVSSCGGCEHADQNGDGVCEACGETFTERTSVGLVENGVATFNIVYGSGIGIPVSNQLKELQKALEKIDLDIDVNPDKAGNEIECEVLVGNVTSRGDEYLYDVHTLGKEGYIIKRIGTKVIINAGSTELLEVAVERFTEKILGFKAGKTKELTNVYMTDLDNVLKVQDNYLTFLYINGKELDGYVIATDLKNNEYRVAAENMQNDLYVNTGNYLNVVDVSEAPEKAIVIRRVEKDGSEGFRAYVSGESLYIECAYDNAFTEALDKFLNNEIKLVEGNVNFDGSYLYKDNVSIVTYEKFGAVGDGRTDDLSAIKKTHEYANAGGQTVVAKSNATYYIKKVLDPISIRTNVDWNTAKFIIDDTNLTGGPDIFSVDSDYKSTVISSSAEINKIFEGGKIDKENFTRVTWEYGYPAMLVPQDNNTIRYKRDGGGGGYQRELVSIDKDGNVSPDTPCLFDFNTITGVTIIRTDDTPLTISGGIFTTKATQKNITSQGTYYIGRGITITRSNTTIEGITHYIEGEKDGIKAAAYSGFVSVHNCENVLIKDSVFTAHKYYKMAGTYDLSFGLSNNVVLKNCTQTNFYLADGKTPTVYNGYWGIAASNACKNLIYDSCVLTRFDAHEGLYNGKIINSTIGVVELTGGGEMYMENVTFVTEAFNYLVLLRPDYGSTWEGTMIFKNCHVINGHPTSTNYLIQLSWENLNYGMDETIPNVIVDGLTFYKINSNGKIRIFNSPSSDNIHTDRLENGTLDHTAKNDANSDGICDVCGVLMENKCKLNKKVYTPAEYVTVKNVSEEYHFYLLARPVFLSTKLEGVEWE